MVDEQGDDAALFQVSYQRTGAAAFIYRNETDLFAGFLDGGVEAGLSLDRFGHSGDWAFHKGREKTGYFPVAEMG